MGNRWIDVLLFVVCFQAGAKVVFSLGFLGIPNLHWGTIAELFGHNIGVQLSLPGGLFEISLSIYLIIKGFRQVEPVAAYPSLAARRLRMRLKDSGFTPI